LAALTPSGQKAGESAVSERSNDLSSRAGLALLKNLIRTADLGKDVRQVVLSHDGQLIAFGGYQSKMQAQRITSQINGTWEGEEESVQIQFIQVAGAADPILLYSRLAAGLLLTLAAVPDISISELRGKADQLVDRITGNDVKDTPTGLPSTQSSPGIEKPENGSHGHSFVIAWRPRKSLPAEVQAMVRQSVRRVAQNNDCVISHLTVEDEVIQLVVACPPGRDGAWAVELFKDETEADICAHYGVPASLWQAGYYAKASRRPYTRAELTIFAKQFLQG
jgi:REP element-mobilizing transposase RayT